MILVLGDQTKHTTRDELTHTHTHTERSICLHYCIIQFEGLFKYILTCRSNQEEWLLRRQSSNFCGPCGEKQVGAVLNLSSVRMNQEIEM